MCNFLSAIVMPSGQLLHCPSTHSHSVIARIHNIRDDRDLRIRPAPFAKLELTPPVLGDDCKPADLDPDKWNFKVDEDTIPSWLTDTLREQSHTKMKMLLRDMIVHGHHEFLGPGVYVLGPDADVCEAYNVRIALMCGKSKIFHDHFSRIDKMEHQSRVDHLHTGSFIESMVDNSFVGMCYGHVWSMKGQATIDFVTGQIRGMHQNSRVSELASSGQINNMCDRASVGTARGRIMAIYGQANVGVACDCCHIVDVRGKPDDGKPIIVEAKENATIVSLSSQSSVGSIKGNARILNDLRPT